MNSNQQKHSINDQPRVIIHPPQISFKPSFNKKIAVHQDPDKELMKQNTIKLKTNWINDSDLGQSQKLFISQEILEQAPHQETKTEMLESVHTEQNNNSPKLLSRSSTRKRSQTLEKRPAKQMSIQQEIFPPEDAIEYREKNGKQTYINENKYKHQQTVPLRELEDVQSIHNTSDSLDDGGDQSYIPMTYQISSPIQNEKINIQTINPDHQKLQVLESVARKSIEAVQSRQSVKDQEHQPIQTQYIEYNKKLAGPQYRNYQQPNRNSTELISQDVYDSQSFKQFELLSKEKIQLLNSSTEVIIGFDTTNIQTFIRDWYLTNLSKYLSQVGQYFVEIEHGIKLDQLYLFVETVRILSKKETSGQISLSVRFLEKLNNLQQFMEYDTGLYQVRQFRDHLILKPTKPARIQIKIPNQNQQKKVIII